LKYLNEKEGSGDYSYVVFDPKKTEIVAAIKFEKGKQAVIYDNSRNLIAEEYHKAKADGSNPELVKAVEDIIGKNETTPTEVSKPKITVVEDRHDTPINIDDIGEGFVLHRGSEKGGSGGFNSLDKSGGEGYGKDGVVESSVIKKGAKVLKLVSGDTENYKNNEEGINEFYKIVGEKLRNQKSEWLTEPDPSDITQRLWGNNAAVKKLKEAGVDVVIGNTIDGVDAFVVNKNAVEKYETKENKIPNTTEAEKPTTEKVSEVSGTAEKGLAKEEKSSNLAKQNEKDANDIITGKKVFERFSPSEQRGIADGGKIHAEATLLLNSNEGTSGENNSDPQTQEDRVEKYAKDKGIWTDNTTSELTKKYGEPIASGEEAIVWGDEKDGKVIKTQDTFQYDNLQQKLDGITLHNAYFPEAPLKVLGFGRNSKGEFQVIVEQPFVKGEKLTPQEIKNHLEKIGFKEDENGHFSNKNTIIEDVHTGNAIKTPKGNIVVIDPIMRLNTEEQGYGGERKISDKITEVKPTESEGEVNKEISSRTSGEKNEGKEPPIEPPTDKITNVNGDTDPELVKMANAINDEKIKGKFGTKALDSVMSKLEDTNVKELYNRVKGKIEKGTINPKEVRERLMTTGKGNEYDQAVLMYDLADLTGKEIDLQNEIISESDESKKQQLQQKLIDVQNEMMDNALANRALGRSASSIFRLRQAWVNREKSIQDFEEQYMSSKGIDKLSSEQKKEVRQAYNSIRESKAKLAKIKEELDTAKEENAKLKIENEKLSELKNKSAIQKSNERINKAKDNLKKLGGELNAGFNPKIAVEIAKIAGEKVYQGIVKFDELVKNIYDDIKDVLPNFTEEDVANHLLTEKDNKGNLVPSLLSKRYQESKKLVDESDKSIREKVEAYQKAQKEVALKQFEWDKQRRIDIMSKKPLRERIIDSVLRYQRFAVLSYISTFVKLLAVVAHQLTLKPIKWLSQKLVSAITPKSITSKQTIWGNPEFSSLGKYYSEFIRNFALSNLKEHFKGIDTKELLYGKPMMYDEFNAATGLLDMPGRSHGYIKSFIKNPEFQYAHEQQMVYNLSKMAELRKKMDNENLSSDEKEQLQSEYDKYDVTNEDVLERINKLALEHGKWAILMNDNKFVDKFRKFTNESGITGALIKSELPVLKIPINYVSRAFATKYGLVQALLGKGKETMPSVFRLIKEGTNDLTESQANLLGRTLTLGSIGASFFALGYIIRKNVKENEDGSIDINGTHVSKSLIHSPEFESFFSGVYTGNKFEKENKKDAKKWITDYVESDIEIAKKNPFMTMLKYGFVGNVAQSMLSKKSKEDKLDKVENAVFRKVADMTVPGFIKQPAGWMDTKEKGIHPMGTPINRNPTGNELDRFWQTFESNLPILRKNVPERQKTSNNPSILIPK
jgi:Serine/Threonine/Tyrosine Kinase found in polyvalent proteins